ncbi:MAG: sarcosine oxidase subunit gamma family protein [Pseudomonadota bacterium]
MSDPAMALGGAKAAGVIAVREGAPRGMITLRGDLSAKELRNAATGVAGVDFPEPVTANCVGERGICWMSPDEVLVLLPHDTVEAAVSSIARTLKGTHHMAVNVSDARAVFELEGEGAVIRDTLAKLTPADMRPAALPVLAMRRTRLAQVPAAFFFHSEGYAELICFRSVAGYVFDLLKNAAAPGAEVGHF